MMKIKREMTLQPHQIIRKWSMPEPNTGCWIWFGNVNDKGYGMLTFQSKKFKAHRFSYNYLVDEIPEGMCVCHACDVPLCVNPQHLFIGTLQDNINDKLIKKRHPFGDKHAMTKLDKDAIKIIREAWDNFGRGSQNNIASYFGISQQNVSSIVHGRTWKHL